MSLLATSSPLSDDVSHLELIPPGCVGDANYEKNLIALAVSHGSALCGRGAASWGMTDQESDPATLFRLYLDNGQHAEATNLLLEYLESFAALRPTDVIYRKRMSAIWFLYTAIERLWCQLEELQSAAHMFNQCDKLKRLLHGTLLNHGRQEGKGGLGRCGCFST